MVKLIRFDDEDANSADVDRYLLVVEVAQRYGVHPSMSTDSERFFGQLLEQFTGDSNNLPAWLEERILRDFVAVNERPRWIQNPEWPFSDGNPMIFAGQIDLTAQQEGLSAVQFHDDTSLYIFIDKKGQTRVVIQQY